MQPTAQRIVEALDDPPKLEALYREDPEAFRDAFGAAEQSEKPFE